MTRFTSVSYDSSRPSSPAVRSPFPAHAHRRAEPNFKSGVAMVPLTVTVTDTTGKHVTGLTGNDFTVFEDGVEQPLSFFACDEVPVDVALVVDTSGSMRADLPLVQSAAIGLVRKLRAVRSRRSRRGQRQCRHPTAVHQRPGTD